MVLVVGTWRYRKRAGECWEQEETGEARKRGEKEESGGSAERQVSSYNQVCVVCGSAARRTTTIAKSGAVRASRKVDAALPRRPESVRCPRFAV